jgi:uncharacterized protein
MRSRLGDVTKISFGMQSNGTLISPAMIEVLKRHQISTGISLDGPKQINDLGRKDHAAQSTYDRAAEGIRQLQINRLLGGILCTIQLEADPLETYSHLKSFAPRMLEFNLSLGSYDNPPPGKIAPAHSDTAYADWLIPIFDAWYAEKPMQTSIRFFHDIMTLLLGAKSSVETLGLGPVDIIAIETNGAIEAVDTMKIAGEGAPELQLNVCKNSFDDALLHPKVQMRQATVKSLCITCQECPISAVCGGGYFPTRYSSSNGFNNPSVFCTDLYKLITHIRRRMLDTFSETGIGLAARELPPGPPLKLHHESA